MSAADYAGAAETAWRALRYFNLYRLVISGLFLLLIVTGNLPPPLAAYDRGLFAAMGVAYFLAAVAAQVLVERRWPARTLQISGQVLIDIVAFTVMMYASGGVTSGFGMLIVVSIAAGSLLSAERLAIVFAAIATLAVLGEELYAWALFYPVANYTHAGLLGATFFATAFLGYVLGRRVRESEALASQRAVDLANLARLNEHIIQRMQAGVVALDPGDRVRLMNASAAQLLGTAADVTGRALAEVAPELGELQRSRDPAGRMPSQPFRARATGTEMIASFTGLGGEPGQGTLVFLEDAAATRQRVQQLKLASLGRMAASIAHEVRNPLGAISHAAQLLSESVDRRPEDLQLTRIIREQSERVNGIIASIQQLGRRDPSVPEQFDLGPWLTGFAAEFGDRHGLAAGELSLAWSPAVVPVRMDRGQLRQVLWNLCENALRYSRVRPRVTLEAGVNPAHGRPYLDIADTGPGIAAEVRDHIFEPFFTTDVKGTGLGLYLAQELCESNQASLILFRNGPSGCTFRINFAHPDRQQPTP